MMHRRRFLIAAAGGLAAGSGRAAPVLDASAAVLLVPEGRARLLRHFTPAAGPLTRHASRVGAWYALLYVPVAPLWPVRLLLWSTAPGHDLRLFALDAPPDEAPGVVHPLPFETELSRAERPPRRSSRFALPATSTAPAIFVLVEQWRIDAEPPPPLWVELRAQGATQSSTTPWWASRAAASTGQVAASPPSPLTQQLRDDRPYEVPILRLRAAPETGIWR